jgi:hypothetical protein
MFFISATVLAVALAALSRRPLHGLLEREVRAIPILWAAVGLHLLFLVPALQPLTSSVLWPAIPQLGGLMYIASLSLLVVFAWRNRHILGVLVIGAGLLMNTVVIAGNDGQMPVDPVQLAAWGYLEEELEIQASGRWSSHTIMGDETNFWFLGDWLLAPIPFRNPVIASPGDYVIAAGILLFFMVIPEARRRRPLMMPRNQAR